ncbi:hypothetical protein PM8797T_01159 [Gimesia maris DSM 8797]|nr:hypothetical protein PM8797T_01159 [Gimesia maris DSM 8797]
MLALSITKQVTLKKSSFSDSR